MFFKIKGSIFRFFFAPFFPLFFSLFFLLFFKQRYKIGDIILCFIYFVLPLTVGVKLLPPPRFDLSNKNFREREFRTLEDVSNKPHWNHGGEVIWHPR